MSCGRILLSFGAYQDNTIIVNSWTGDGVKPPRVAYLRAIRVDSDNLPTFISQSV